MTTDERSDQPAVAFDDLATLLPDWRISLKARGRQASTVLSYLNVGRDFLAFLHAQGMPTAVGSIKRKYVEHQLAAMFDRGVAPATVAKHYRSLQQMFRKAPVVRPKAYRTQHRRGHTHDMTVWGTVTAAALVLTLSSCSVQGGTAPAPSTQPSPDVTTVTAAPTSNRSATKIVQVDPPTPDGTVDDTYNVEDLGKDDKSGFLPVDKQECNEPSSYGSTPGTYACGVTALGADACWLEAQDSIVCIYLPWERDLSRIAMKERPDPTSTVDDPQPLAVETEDGSRYRARHSASGSTRSDGLLDALICAEGPCEDDSSLAWVLDGDDIPAVDKSSETWTVQVGGNDGEPTTHDVVRAWFISAA